jgi:small-conductance mechanosensitive channel
VPTALLKTASVGALGGIAGILMSRWHLDPAFDEEEERDLRRFTIDALLITIAAALAFANLGYDGRRWLRLATLLVFIAIILYQYIVRLPKILARRLQWERQVNPEIAKQRKWQQIYAAVGQAAGAAIGGIAIMTLLHC